ncbi:GNAT family N-acetyltransferase [Oceaniglobus ichthyenteri]|uniref:GNAT family N-acetyltransferase n=1 Tax=Oceaniglobus ichthyenteri TaxID=2136177 RepID=UPI000D33FC60|nr:GNAT family N-acetyltransferase [Oceaniglobus ichthyenteri]
MPDTPCHIPVLTTDRLILRAHVRADFEPMAEMWAGPQSRFMGGPRDRRGAWSAFASDCAGWVFDGFGCWAIETHDKTLVGQIGITHPDHFPEPELGWVLLPHAIGKGFATEAAKAALAFARDALKLSTLVSYIAPENSPSRSLAERLGATVDPKAPLPAGETVQDTLVYRHRFAL